jgi:pyruvate/2-oxoglutarate/acetoin dehydrogenase E1 component
MARVHPLSVPIPFSPVLENAVLPDVNRIIAAVMNIV